MCRLKLLAHCISFRCFQVSGSWVRETKATRHAFPLFIRQLWHELSWISTATPNFQGSFMVVEIAIILNSIIIACMYGSSGPLWDMCALCSDQIRTFSISVTSNIYSSLLVRPLINSCAYVEIHIMLWSHYYIIKHEKPFFPSSYPMHSLSNLSPSPYPSLFSTSRKRSFRINMKVTSCSPTVTCSTSEGSDQDQRWKQCAWACRASRDGFTAINVSAHTAVKWLGLSSQEHCSSREWPVFCSQQQHDS